MRQIKEATTRLILQPVLEDLESRFPDKMFYPKSFNAGDPEIVPYRVYQVRESRPFFIYKKITQLRITAAGEVLENRTLNPDYITDERLKELLDPSELRELERGLVFALESASDYTSYMDFP